MKVGTLKEAWRKYWHIYVFIILTAISLLRVTHIWADEYDPRTQLNLSIHHMESSILCAYENQFEAINLCKFYTMNAEYDACKTYADKRDFHKRNAERCIREAKNMCWYFPPKMRDKSLFAFENVAIFSCTKDLKSKVVAVLVITLIEYGADAYEEWTNMNTKLHWAEFHYDQYEFFSDVVKHGNP